MHTMRIQPARSTVNGPTRSLRRPSARRRRLAPFRETSRARQRLADQRAALDCGPVARHDPRTIGGAPSGPQRRSRSAPGDRLDSEQRKRRGDGFSVSLGRRQGREQRRAIEVDLVAVDPPIAELHGADAVDFDGGAAGGDRGVPFVEEAVGERDRAAVGPDPGGVAGEELAEIRAERGAAADPSGSAGSE